MADERTLTVDGREIRWVLTRKKVKNVNLRVKPDGIVYISAGARVPIKFIEGFIAEKSGFIFSAIDRMSIRGSRPELPKAENIYKNGDTVSYFGENYTLRIIISPSEGAEEENGVLTVYAKSGDRAGKVLEKFYAEKTRQFFGRLNLSTCEMFRAKGYDVPLADLQIREMRSRWGSCHYAKGKIVMNSRLALYPEVCARYVFIHEYAHFVVLDHSAAFYAVVKQLMPDYKICVNMLKN
ncbi:MAG: M48 family metallopeptidase [Oscillospiraceae bacterium]|nr:M48 family metallopeptidase [Oscillospiraceae bacterium]